MQKSNNSLGRFLSEHPLFAVFTFSTICFLPVMIFRDFTTSNELRYISIADEALRDGHFFAFYNHGLEYADKPPLYLWITMLCRSLFGDGCGFALTLFSIIPAFVIIRIMDKWVMQESRMSDRVAMAMMTMTSVMFLGAALVMRMDMLMCMFIVLALYTFYRMYVRDNGGGPEEYCDKDYVRDSWLLPVYIFMALFTKGPVGLLVPPLGILVFLIWRKRGHGICKYLGWKTWGTIAGLAAIWIGCVWIEGGNSYLSNLLFKQTAGRAVNAFTHSRPVWYYFTAILYCIAPYCIVLVGAFAASFFKGTSSRSDKEALFVSVIAATFIMLSSFSSKLSIYLLPLIPFCTYLFPMVLARHGWRKWIKWGLAIPAAMFVIVGIGALLVLSGTVNIKAANDALAGYPFVRTGIVNFGLGIFTIGNTLALFFLFRRDSWQLCTFCIASSMMLTVYAVSGLVGKINPYIGFKDVCTEVPADSKVVTLYLHRPENMDVFLHRDIADYHKDLDAFLGDIRNGKFTEEEKVSIITTVARVEKHPELREFMFDGGIVAYVGPYCVKTFNPKQLEK